MSGIKNTFLRRWGVILAVKVLRRVRPSLGTVLFVTQNLCVKYGELVPLSEASTLCFVGGKTSIPVPKVHCAFVHKGKTYILMERLKGEMVARGWTTRSEESKSNILRQLKGMVEELRSLTPPNQLISSVDGGPLFDCRFPGTSFAGPFVNIQEFHNFLRNGTHLDQNLPPEINKMIMLQDRPWPEPVFTHGDLSSLNILVQRDNIIGIIDWESAGWYPSYWEYSMAWHVNPFNVFWRQEVGKFLQATPEEEEMERIRLHYFGDI